MKAVGTVLAVVMVVAILSGNVDGGREGIVQAMELVNTAFMKCKNEVSFDNYLIK